MSSNERNLYAKKYLSYLVDSFDKGWKLSYEEHSKNSNIDELVLSKLVLLHPTHFRLFFPAFSKEDIDKLQFKIQGKRSFPIVSSRKKCCAIEIWGYDCPFTNEILVRDHDFPYSMGGPTDNAYNKKVLCRWHNMIKGNDIHTFNWQKLFEDYNYSQIEKRTHWIDSQLFAIRNEFNL